MGSTGNSLIKGIDIQEIIDTLDSFHAQSWVVVHFSQALKNRLEGHAAFLLSKELEDKAQESIKHAKKLAERIAKLGGAETGDPTEFVMLSQLKRFSMPSSTSDVKVILSYILEQEQKIIRKYGDFMIKIRDKDDLTFHLLREILEDEIRHGSEIEAIVINSSRNRESNGMQKKTEEQLNLPH
ncbi:MAG TPA: ferritin-like domain-containing protein [Nitrososphaeraceae archaeon]|nr:ferritin-like domain-containing protein [Nitrososphaeraceae archaeon]